MNEQAVVLAADSASTVTYWNRGQAEQRYFKGANKLFQLSNHHPVGLMIFGSAVLHDIPWEILIKDFRQRAGKESSDHLPGYALRFFEFIRSHQKLLPDSHRANAFRRMLDLAVFHAGSVPMGMDKFKDADPENKPLVGRGILETGIAQVSATQPVLGITSVDVESALAKHDVLGKELFDENLKFFDSAVAGNKELVVALAIRTLFTNPLAYMSESGVVFGGYGDDDYFPSIEVYRCYGFLDGHFLLERQDQSKSIEPGSSGVMEAFATTSMINTFRVGIAPDVFGRVNEASKNAFRRIALTVRDSIAPGVEVPDLDALVEKELTSHRNEWFRGSFDDHHGPLARVIGSLPVTDMAALAKSLVELQSLKERVTRPTESVGGPIDVAAISKHDGFVWVERKHYFKPELNPRFFLRQRVKE